MNRLLALLRLENNLTRARLKQLYRQLSKKTHPDARPGQAPGAHEAFVRLRGEYEEALEILGEGLPASVPAPEEGRGAVLRLLYQYAVRFFGKDSAGILDRLQQAARPYSSALHSLPIASLSPP